MQYPSLVRSWVRNRFLLLYAADLSFCVAHKNKEVDFTAQRDTWNADRGLDVDCKHHSFWKQLLQHRLLLLRNTDRRCHFKSFLNKCWKSTRECCRETFHPFTWIPYFRWSILDIRHLTGCWGSIWVSDAGSRGFKSYLELTFHQSSVTEATAGYGVPFQLCSPACVAFSVNRQMGFYSCYVNMWLFHTWLPVIVLSNTWSFLWGVWSRSDGWKPLNAELFLNFEGKKRKHKVHLLRFLVALMSLAPKKGK